MFIVKTLETESSSFRSEMYMVDNIPLLTELDSWLICPKL
jgi:hypothetical protein